MFGIRTVVGLCFLGALTVSASTVDFSTMLMPGNLPQSVSVGGLTVSGWAVSKTDGTQWSNTVILNNRRDSADDRGLGVCSNPSFCPASGNGNINEIDNNGRSFDVIRLDFGIMTNITSVGLSSLDGGLKDGFAIFGSNTALPNLSLLTPLAQGTNQSIGQVDPIIRLNQSFRYLFVAPENRVAYSSNSDFLLESVSSHGITTGNVPEPYTAGMLAFGLAIVGALRYRSAKRLG